MIAKTLTVNPVTGKLIRSILSLQMVNYRLSETKDRKWMFKIYETEAEARRIVRVVIKEIERYVKRDEKLRVLREDIRI